MLQAGVAQQIMRVVDRSFRSFFSLLKKSKDGGYDGKRIRIPHYRKKGGLFNLILSTNSISIKDGKFRIPMIRSFMAAHPDIKPIVIPFPERLNGTTIKEVRIIPFDIGDALEISNHIEIYGGDSAKESCGMYKDALQGGVSERGAFVFYDCLCPSENGPVNWGIAASVSGRAV